MFIILLLFYSNILQLIDFVYVKFLTSTSDFTKRKCIIFNMKPSENKKSSPKESLQEYGLVEYPDYFVTNKNKKVNVKHLGDKTAQISSYFFEYFKGYNIPCAFVEKESKNKLKLLNTEDFRFQIKIINSIDARTAKIFSVKAGSPLQLPLIEYHYGSSKDTLVTESHLISFNLCTYDELKLMNRLCSKINAILISYLERRNTLLLELTCIFGKFEGKIYLVGDFSPDSIKVFDNEKKDKLPDPYKIETFAQMRKYSDYLLKLTNGD